MNPLDQQKGEKIYKGDLEVWKGKKKELGDVVYERVKIKGEGQGG